MISSSLSRAARNDVLDDATDVSLLAIADFECDLHHPANESVVLGPVTHFGVSAAPRDEPLSTPSGPSQRRTLTSWTLRPGPRRRRPGQLRTRKLDANADRRRVGPPRIVRDGRRPHCSAPRPRPAPPGSRRGRHPIARAVNKPGVRSRCCRRLLEVGVGCPCPGHRTPWSRPAHTSHRTEGGTPPDQPHRHRRNRQARAHRTTSR